ncbi:MAG: DNA starvation/stationary phase protection protein [Holosporales bacterium]|jgi:starvation-inducible DNA-binding protein|nr:DNA starvation/stationary phase protection protein [Holosporales bacterium]
MSCSCENSCKCDSADILSKLLANTYVLLLKTQNVHWNVTGENFRSIHIMTEDHYDNLFEAIDKIAERIRMVKGKAPATFEEYSKLACFSDKMIATSAVDMVKTLLEDHKTIRDGLKKAITTISETDDFATVDLLTGRLAFHEKIIWMLDSSLNK